MGEETSVRKSPVGGRPVGPPNPPIAQLLSYPSNQPFHHLTTPPPHFCPTSEETEADLASQSVDMSFTGSLTDVRIIMAAPLHLAVLAGHTDTALALATYKHRTGRRGRHDAWADAEEKEKEEQGGCVGVWVGVWECGSIG